MEQNEKRNLSPEEEIIKIILSGESDEAISEALYDYHENDIANAIEELDRDARKKLSRILGMEKYAEILSYLDNVSDYLDEFSLEDAAGVLESMDADDAVDALEDFDDEEKREQLIALMDDESSKDIQLISSFDDDEIGHMMTTNYVVISENFSIKEAMRSLIKQAQENDNINTIYVMNDEKKYAGAIELKDLITASEHENLENIISRSYPSINAHEKIYDNIERIKSYAEDSIPVLNDEDELIGVITATDIIEAVDDELGDDYAKLAGLTAEEDLREKLFDSMKKRMPWLILLLLLGMAVSSVVGVFEQIIAAVPIFIAFQSLILDMAGNVGTQSLAVTIRVLMDEEISGRTKLGFVFKEMRVGALNGTILGSVSFLFVGFYLHFLKGYVLTQGFMISACVGIALFLAMVISSFVGTVIPMFFHKIKVDPAVASGPLITTVNDLVAVVTYYSLAGLLINSFNLVA